ncbi:DinB family protein [Ekhidna sp. To15]|uniref:DinB family protein n=1 Tax=Ekhidna sp. To15 TaxID=3395267 RepID=UPI003F522EE3
MEVNFEQILQQSNKIKNYIKADVAELPDKKLNWKPNEKKWSALEVVSHLNRVYEIYLDNFESAISGAPDLPIDETLDYQSTLLGRISIYIMKPRGRKRRFKMKTFDFFNPISEPENKHATIDLFLKNKATFNDLIKQARNKNLKNIKMPTALGEKMKFYVPECFRFILAHEERHIVQIASILEEME